VKALADEIDLQDDHDDVEAGWENPTE
jgi:hypothetical protein